MSVLQKEYIFDTSANFNANNAEVDEINDVGKLLLVDNAGQVFSQDFSSDVGFAYDPLKSQFIAGMVEQVDQTPLNSRFAALYDSITNANWNKDGSTTGTLNGAPTIVSNRLACNGAKGVRYSVTNSGVGAVKFKYKPNYVGAPPSNVNLFILSNASTGHSRIALTHSPSGDNFRLSVIDSAGVVKVSTAAIGGSGVNLNLANTYEIELNWNNTNGTIRLFLDGALWGTTSIAPWTHGTGVANLDIGASTIVYNLADGNFEDVVYFNQVQHTAGYTPGYTLPAFIYAENKVDFPPFVYTGIGTIQSVDGSTQTKVGSPQYIVGDKYWDGADWVISDGSYVQSNDLPTIVTNLPALDVVGAPAIPVSLVFTNSNTLSSVDEVSVTVTGQKYAPIGYIEPVDPIQSDQLVNYVESISTSANTQVKIAIKVSGILKYYNTVSSLWETSDGSEAQSNTAAEIVANMGTLLTEDTPEFVYIRWILITTSNIETPEISTATLDYNFAAVQEEVATCLVYGYIKNISNFPVSGVTLKFEAISLGSNQYKEAGNSIVSPLSISVKTDKFGYFEIQLIRSSSFEVANNYKVTITYRGRVVTSGSDGLLDFTVPDEATLDLTTLLPTP